MARWAELAAVVGAVVAGVYLAGRKTQQKPKLVGPVALVGDSLAEGLAPRLAGGMKARGVSFKGYGRSGTTAAQWLTQGWLDQVLASKPKTVLISLGTNDSVSKAGADTFPTFMRDVVAKVRSAGATPYWVAPPKMPWGIHGVSGVEIIAAPSSVPRQSDNVHPTTAGYEQWAQHIIGWFS